jgi:hypothetical protein
MICEFEEQAFEFRLGSMCKYPDDVETTLIFFGIVDLP